MNGYQETVDLREAINKNDIDTVVFLCRHASDRILLDQSFINSIQDEEMFHIVSGTFTIRYNDQFLMCDSYEELERDFCPEDIEEDYMNQFKNENEETDLMHCEDIEHFSVSRKGKERLYTIGSYSENTSSDNNAFSALDQVSLSLQNMDLSNKHED